MFRCLSSKVDDGNWHSFSIAKQLGLEHRICEMMKPGETLLALGLLEVDSMVYAKLILRYQVCRTCIDRLPVLPGSFD